MFHPPCSQQSEAVWSCQFFQQSNVIYYLIMNSLRYSKKWRLYNLINLMRNFGSDKREHKMTLVWVPIASHNWKIRLTTLFQSLRSMKINELNFVLFWCVSQLITIDNNSIHIAYTLYTVRRMILSKHNKEHYRKEGNLNAARNSYSHTHTHVRIFYFCVWTTKWERERIRRREGGWDRWMDGWMDGVKEDKNARVSEIDTVYRADRSRIPWKEKRKKKKKKMPVVFQIK